MDRRAADGSGRLPTGSRSVRVARNAVALKHCQSRDLSDGAAASPEHPAKRGGPGMVTVRFNLHATH